MNDSMLQTLREYFKNTQVERAWIFGSFSRGEEREDSDVDILISIIPGAKFSLLDHSGMICDLEQLLHRPIDIVKDGTLLPFAADSAERDKILVYERAA